MVSARERVTSELKGLGLTALEAAIYLHLVKHPRSTGYRVAHAIGKPTANVYAALESLRKKGAIVADQAKSRVYRALPADGLQRVFEERFRDRARRLDEALAQWQGGGSDAGVYQLTEPEQVYAQAQAMLKHAKSVALADLFPVPLAKLNGALESTAARGVPVAAQVYEPVSLRGVDLVMGHRGREVMARWPGQWLALVTDGSEYLVALLSEDGTSVIHSTWTRSPHLAWTTHSTMSGDLIATKLIAALEVGEPARELKSLATRMQKRLRAPEAAGYQRLVGAAKGRGRAAAASPIRNKRAR